MWGASRITHRGRELLERSLNNIIHSGDIITKRKQKFHDQHILREQVKIYKFRTNVTQTNNLLLTFVKHFSFIWDVWGEKKGLQHDSYNCLRFANKSYHTDVRPYPTQRPVGNFNHAAASMFRNRPLDEICPEECKPREHQDWTIC